MDQRVVEFWTHYHANNPTLAVDTAGLEPIKVGPFTGYTLHREGRFQVQLWMCPPMTEIPDHAHPNVDVIQVYMSGQVYLRKNGKQILTQEGLDALSARRRQVKGLTIRVRPGDTHGATMGPSGGAFISAELWMNGEPTSVELDWSGPPIDGAHKEKLRDKRTASR